MYCIDTLKRMNDKEVARHRAEQQDCEYCDKKAGRILAVYNPADAVREPPVEGTYCTVAICEECEEEGYLYEQYFECPGCGEWFIINHSWDVVAVKLEDGYHCQKCAVEELQPIPLSELYEALERGDTKVFTRINSIPGKKELWTGEFSQYSDFPGHTTFDSLQHSIEEAARINNLSIGTLVYPIIDHGYQFSVSLAVYY